LRPACPSTKWTSPRNQAAFEYITEELGYSQVPVVVYDKDGTENHWSGLNPGKIEQIIAIEAAAGRVREA
jgi:glutaredoxin-like protein NrdH